MGFFSRMLFVSLDLPTPVGRLTFVKPRAGSVYYGRITLGTETKGKESTVWSKSLSWDGAERD